MHHIVFFRFWVRFFCCYGNKNIDVIPDGLLSGYQKCWLEVAGSALSLLAEGSGVCIMIQD